MSKLTFAKVAASAYNPIASGPSSKSAMESKTNGLGQSPGVTIKPMHGAIQADTKPILPVNGANETESQAVKRAENDIARSDDGELKQSQDDRSTQISSDDSLKPLSFDTKSVASAATFALDEKESLRPDDSASMRAVPVEEEEMFSPPGSVVAGSRVGSDNGSKAFREQLHEIAYMSSSASRPTGGPFAQAILANPAHSQANASGTQNVSPAVNMKGCDLPTPDEALLEALQSQRDRVWVLKLEQDIIDFIEHSKESKLTLPQCNGFYRKLAHRLADYYRLDHTVEQNQTGAAVVMTRTEFCKLAPPLSALPNPSTASSTPPFVIQKRKIMRRSDDPKTSETSTAANSEGPSAAASEVDAPSSSNSDRANQSSGTDDKFKSRPTREERVAKYAEVRLRIFGEAEPRDEAAESALDSGETDNSRASSTTGKKKNGAGRKQRTLSNDDFEPRSQFPGFYNSTTYGSGTAYPTNPYYYGQMPFNQNQQPIPLPMNANSMNFPPAQQHITGSDSQSPYQWHHQPAGMAPYGPNSGYDLNSHFQSGMQSFQSAPSNQGANIGPPHPAPGFPSPPSWPQPSYDQYGRPIFQSHAMNDRSAAVPSPPMSYGYGQYPQYPYNGGHLPKGVSPMNYNARPPFNPQTQSFVPGHHMSPNTGQHPFLPFNNFIAPSMHPNSKPVSGQMTSCSPFSVPRNHISSNSHSSQSSPNVQGLSNSPGQRNQTIQNGTKPVPEITAKWGTPSHLPPKPPTPQALDAHKFAGLPMMPKRATSVTSNGSNGHQGGATQA